MAGPVGAPGPGEVPPEQGRRLTRVLAALGLPAADPVHLPGDSNDSWRVGGLVLRICWRGDRTRFEREALLAAHLPAAVPYPRVVEVGADDQLAWQVTEFVEGSTLAGVWPTLSPAERRAAVHQLGTALAALHGHRFPPAVLAALGRPRLPVASDDDIVGADLNPLPVARALRLIRTARAVPFVDPRMLDRVEGRLRALAALDPFARDQPAGMGRPAGIVHGDAHPGNVLWRAGRVVALLDLEWARVGPAYLELQPFLEVDHDDPVEVAGAREVLGWLRQSHPGAFAGPLLAERLTLVELAYTLRHVLVWPPTGPAETQPRGHPVHRLRRLVEQPRHLDRLLGQGIGG